MGVITISVTPKSLAEFWTAWPEMMETAKANIARRMQVQGQALVEAMLGRWQTGQLARSLTAAPTARGITMQIGSGVPHADYVFFGADEHIIRPRTGKALSWERFGMKFVFGKVKHPGQPARTDIFNALEVLFMRIVEEELEAMIIARSMAS